MALTKRSPNTVHLGGHITRLNENIAGVEITPGMGIELYDDGGKMKWRPVNSATTMSSTIVALEKTLHNKTVDDTYAVGELVLAAEFHKGSTFWGLVPSGQDIIASDYMQNNGDGKFKEATSAAAGDNLARLQAIEAIGAVNADTRCKIQVL